MNRRLNRQKDVGAEQVEDRSISYSGDTNRATSLSSWVMLVPYGTHPYIWQISAGEAQVSMRVGEKLWSLSCHGRMALINEDVDIAKFSQLKSPVSLLDSRI